MLVNLNNNNVVSSVKGKDENGQMIAVHELVDKSG